MTIIRRYAGRFAPLAFDLIRYGSASVLALALDWGVLVYLHKVAGVNYVAAAALGYMTGLMFVYLVSVRYVFSDRRHVPPGREFLEFAAIGLIGLALNEALIIVCVEEIGIPVHYAKGPAAGFVFFFNFLARRYIVFSATRAQKPINGPVESLPPL